MRSATRSESSSTASRTGGSLLQGRPKRGCRKKMPPKKNENEVEPAVWYLALRKLHIVQGPGVKPSSIRFIPGQRFALDGDEAVDVESLMRTRSIKIYEESDAAWAQAQLANAPKPPARRRNRG